MYPSEWLITAAIRPSKSWRDRAADRAHRLQGVVAAVLAVRVGREVVGRPVGGEQQRAAAGVAAVERSLRSFQHLHLRDVEHREVLDPGGAEVDVIEIDAVRAGVVGVEVVQPDPANGDQRLVAGADRADDRHVRGDLAEILGALDAGGDQLPARDGLHRHGHFLDVLAAPLRRHHHLADARGRLRRRLGIGRIGVGGFGRRKHQRGGSCRCQQGGPSRRRSRNSHGRVPQPRRARGRNLCSDVRPANSADPIERSILVFGQV